jgi:hypothetical protein
MSVAIRHKRSNSSTSSPATEAPVRVRPTEPEAPDHGEREREAPEMTRPGRGTSIPEADEGRAGLIEHEFTHGRSQS